MQLASLGRFGLFSARVGWRMVTPPTEIHETARHTWTLVWRCLVPVSAVVFPLGMVLALQGLTIFDLFGAQRLLPGMVTLGVLRELSPVLASVLVAAQGGSAFAAEVGAMRLQEELDATSVMAIDPLRIHVVPRVVAAVLATPMLNVLGTLSGIAGGALVAVGLEGEPGGLYVANLWSLATPVDLLGSFLKTVLFGAIVGLVSTYKGYTASGGPAGVGRAVNDTVVTSAIAFVVVNYLLSTALFGAVE